MSLLCVLAGGCSGTIPTKGGLPEQGISAVIVSGRFLTPTGETQSGRIFVNLDGEGGKRAESYRLPIRPRQSLLYQVEPGLYRLSPTRNIFGFRQPILKVRIEGKNYFIPFPRDILRKAPLDIKPKRIVSIGVVEVHLQPALPGQTPTVKVRLDDSIAARRQIVQDIIHEMMDPATATDDRESAVAWSRALENSLMDLLSETERTPLYKSGP
jgi:hypothetical protein